MERKRGVGRGRREEGKGEQTRKIHQSLQRLLCIHKGLNLISRNVKKKKKRKWGVSKMAQQPKVLATQ